MKVIPVLLELLLLVSLATAAGGTHRGYAGIQQAGTSRGVQRITIPNKQHRLLLSDQGVQGQTAAECLWCFVALGNAVAGWLQPSTAQAATTQQQQQQQQTPPPPPPVPQLPPRPSAQLPLPPPTTPAEPNMGPAVGCIPPTLRSPVPRGPLPSSLSSSAATSSTRRPNFIVILTDDQGWDDVGLHHPQGATLKPRTPNIGSFLNAASKFDNFYVTPMCSQTRAQLLTGRAYPRTGTMLINGGYDYLARDLPTIADIMAAAGYKTSQWGKWHNGRTLGYEPWHLGFQESWLPEAHIHLDNIMRHNGQSVPTKGLMEQVLLDKLIAYLKDQAAAQRSSSSSQPFFAYYALHAPTSVGPRWQRPAPKAYMARFLPLISEGKLNRATAEVWALLEYMDDVLGRLFRFLQKSGVAEDTYVMLMGDNGSALFGAEYKNKKLRMPSGMEDAKMSVKEGGVRNFLAVQGPGVESGVVDSSLLSIEDIMPTILDLAGIRQPSNGIISSRATPDITPAASASSSKPMDGLSFRNLLFSNSGSVAGNASASKPAVRGSVASPLRGTAAATEQQRGRYVFLLSQACWDADAVPTLGPDRRVIRPQPLFDIDTGGVLNLFDDPLGAEAALAAAAGRKGFERCIAVRHGDFKWLGETGKVYRFFGDSHIEQPCNEVTGPEAQALAAQLSAAARVWWRDLAADPHSFLKPTFQLGLKGFAGFGVTNIFPDGAHARTPGRVKLLPNGASGFSQPGDSMCFAVQVHTAGSYEAILFYISQAAEVFQLAVGPFAAISNGSAPSVTARLPKLDKLSGHSMGALELPTSGPNTVTEICLELLTSAPESVFINLANIRFVLVAEAQQALPIPPEDSEEQVETPPTTEAPPATAATPTASAVPASKPQPGTAPASPGTAADAASGSSAGGSCERAVVVTLFGFTLKKCLPFQLSFAKLYESLGGRGADQPPVPIVVVTQQEQQQSGQPSVAQPAPWLDLQDAISVIRATYPQVDTRSTAAAASDSNGGSGGSGGSAGPLFRVPKERGWQALHPHLEASPEMQQTEREAYEAVAAAGSMPASGAPSSPADAWQLLRLRHLWPDGQGQLQSVFSPFDAEGIETCAACLPDI